MSRTTSGRPKKKRPIVSGIIWLGIGIFLAGYTTDLIPPLEYSWPVFIIIVGLALILGAVFRKRKSADSELNNQVH